MAFLDAILAPVRRRQQRRWFRLFEKEIARCGRTVLQKPPKRDGGVVQYDFISKLPHALIVSVLRSCPFTLTVTIVNKTFLRLRLYITSAPGALADEADVAIVDRWLAHREGAPAPDAAPTLLDGVLLQQLAQAATERNSRVCVVVRDRKLFAELPPLPPLPPPPPPPPPQKPREGASETSAASTPVPSHQATANPYAFKLS